MIDDALVFVFEVTVYRQGSQAYTYPVRHDPLTGWSQPIVKELCEAFRVRIDADGFESAHFVNAQARGEFKKAIVGTGRDDVSLVAFYP